MTKAERRRRDGYCVKDWSKPAGYIKHFFPIIRNRVEMFLAEHPVFLRRSACVLRTGHSADNPSAIVVEFRKNHESRMSVFSERDESLIISFVNRRMIPQRLNLKSVQIEHTSFHLTFEVLIRSFYPFEDKQPELDVFGRFGGNASPPDITRAFDHQRYPYEPPYYPPKDIQRLLDLGPFVCGNSMPRWPITITFSDLDPGEEDDVRYDYPPLERVWCQMEFEWCL